MSCLRIKKVFKYLFHPRNIYVRFAIVNLKKNSDSLDDKEYLSKHFRIVMVKDINWSNPSTFNEKMQWLKLYNRNNLFTTMVDKHAVKDYISSKIGSKYVAKEVGVYNSVQEIDINKLPDRFVLKTTHGCGGMVVVTDKTQFNLAEVDDKLSRGLSQNYYYNCREWPYKNVPPKIIAEEFLKDDNYDVLPVYKFLCFNGEPYILQAIQNDKHPNESIDYFDMSWNKLPIKQNYPNSKHPLNKPTSFEEMKVLCRKLTKDIPFVRCDFYDVNGRAYFSEFTFFSDAGFERFHPKKWDLILGKKIVLPTIDRNK